MNGKDFSPMVNNLVLAVGVLCLLYYLLCGIYVRFGQSALWVWPLVGGLLILRYFLARAGVIASLPRWLLWTGRSVVALGLAGYLAMMGLIISGMSAAPPQDLDYLVVLGARVNGSEPSLALRTRVERAAEYLKENPRTRVIASGGQGADEDISEAECMIQLLRAANIEEERILREDQSTSTAQNIRFSYAMMENPEATVGVVTNGYHLFRATLIARSHGQHPVSGVEAGSSLLLLPHNMTREFMTLVVGFLRGDFSLSALRG